MDRTQLCATSIALLLAACGGRALTSDEESTETPTDGSGATASVVPGEGEAGAPQVLAGEGGLAGEEPAIEGGEGSETGGVSPGGRPAVGGGTVGGGTVGGGSVGGAPVAGGPSGGVAGGGVYVGGTPQVGGSAGTIAVGGTAGITPPPAGGTGGRPIYVGGAPVGGAVVGGTGAVAGEVPEPVGCEVQYEHGSLTDGYCEVNLACDNDSVYTYCWQEGTGRWGCDCSTNYFYQSYETTVGSEAPCDAVVELCVDAESPAFAAPEACSSTYESAGSDYCEVQRECSRTAEIGGGVIAVERRSEYAHCYEYGDGSLRCDCTAGGAYASYELDGDPSVDQCRRLLDICGTPAPGGEGTVTCEPGYGYSGSDYCQVDQNCTARVPVSDGLALVYSSYEYGHCQSATDGTTNCSCSSLEGSLRFDLDGETEDGAVCWAALDVCRDPAPLELSGSPTCTRAYQSAYTGGCDAQVSCSQPASIGELDLVVYGDVYTYCSSDGAEGAFICQCSSGQQTASFEVEGADEWEVCSLAVGRCPDLVRVQYEGTGNYGGGGIGPVPVD